MRAVIQKVKESSVKVNGSIVSQIGPGLMLLLGISTEDKPYDADLLINKISGLRLFPKEDKFFDLSITDINAEILVVSQFTLYASCDKGRRPDFNQAAKSEEAKKLYDYFISSCKNAGLRLKEGIFGADMEVGLINDGPVTIILDSSSLKKNN